MYEWDEVWSAANNSASVVSRQYWSRTLLSSPTLGNVYPNWMGVSSVSLLSFKLDLFTHSKIRSVYSFKWWSCTQKCSSRACLPILNLCRTGVGIQRGSVGYKTLERGNSRGICHRVHRHQHLPTSCLLLILGEPSLSYCQPITFSLVLKHFL